MASRGSVVKACERCGTEFRRPPSSPGRFCSRECHKLRSNLATRCAVCDKPFTFKRSQLIYYPNAGTYCSTECARSVPGKCVVCAEPFTGPTNQQYCKTHAGKWYMALPELERRGWSMGNTLALPNKRRIVVAMLTAAVGNPCPYCGTTITIANASLDHIEPIGGELRKAPASQRREADREANLHMVCKVCNAAKGDFNDAEFRVLVALPFWPKIAKRLSASRSFWAKKRMSGGPR